MKLFFVLLSISSLSVCSAQKFNVKILTGEWRVCKSGAAPLVFIFSTKSNGEKGLLKNWNNPTDFIYKTPFTYNISEAPKDSLTGNSDIDENLFLMTTSSKTVSGNSDVQTFLVHIATEDSIGFVLKHGFITPLCRVK